MLDSIGYSAFWDQVKKDAERNQNANWGLTLGQLEKRLRDKVDPCWLFADVRGSKPIFVVRPILPPHLLDVRERNFERNIRFLGIQPTDGGVDFIIRFSEITFRNGHILDFWQNSEYRNQTSSHHVSERTGLLITSEYWYQIKAALKDFADHSEVATL